MEFHSFGNGAEEQNGRLFSVTFNGPSATMDDCELILAESNDMFDKVGLF